MTDRTDLERRYRRWLSLYPKAFRADHEEEMIGVLLEGADPGQARPRLREAANLAAHGIGRRIRASGDWDRRHARWMFPVRIVSGLWLLVLTCLLLGYHRGQLWTILTIPSMLAHFYVAYRIRPRPSRR